MHNKVEVVTQVADLAVKAAPPIAVSSLTVFGYQLPDIVSILTILYLCVHIGYIGKKWFKGE